MKMRWSFSVAMFVVVLGAWENVAWPDELTLKDAMLAGERYSPDLKVALAKEAQAQDAIAIRQSYYYPNLEAQGIESFGMAGSNGTLEIGGLMGSPFRKGLAGGVTSKATLFDMGLGHSVEAARFELEAAKAQTEIVRYQVAQAVLQIYCDAARYRGAFESWAEVGKKMQTMAKLVERFVRGGQHSVVEKLLVEDQVQNATMNEAAYLERYRVALKRLALITGMDEVCIACPPISTVDDSALAAIQPNKINPFVASSQAQAQNAHAIVKEKSAENYPSVTALASAGGLQQAKLVERQEYSVGFGVKVPIFEGFRITKEISKAEGLASERDLEVKSTYLNLDEAHARLDEVINASRVKLVYLNRERAMAKGAFALAKRRYLAFQGPLVDVREALRNLGRIESEQNDTRADYLLAKGSKALLDGGVVR